MSIDIGGTNGEMFTVNEFREIYRNGEYLGTFDERGNIMSPEHGLIVNNDGLLSRYSDWTPMGHYYASSGVLDWYDVPPPGQERTEKQASSTGGSAGPAIIGTKTKIIILIVLVCIGALIDVPLFILYVVGNFANASGTGEVLGMIVGAGFFILSCVVVGILIARLVKSLRK